MNRSFAVAVAAVAVAMAAAGGVLQRWTVETSEVSPQPLVAYRGETLDLECRVLSYGKVVDGCGRGEFLWQTNGMGNAWWKTNAVSVGSGTVRAQWTPWMDVGADRYTFFIRLYDRSGDCYRVNGDLTLLGSPSGNPRFVPWPVRVLDFGEVEVWSASASPFSLKADAMTTNAVEWVVGEYDRTNIAARLAAKQDHIQDLAWIRAGSQLGASALQPEAGKRLMRNAEGAKLAGVEPGAQTNVIEAVRVNGVALPVVGKAVDLGMVVGVNTNSVKGIVNSEVGGTQAVKRVVASFGGVSNRVAAIEGKEAGWDAKVSVEVDPTVGITNGTVWIGGTSIRPLTEHQSLSATNDFRRKSDKVAWGDVTNHADFVTESVTNGLASADFVVAGLGAKRDSADLLYSAGEWDLSAYTNASCRTEVVYDYGMWLVRVSTVGGGFAGEIYDYGQTGWSSREAAAAATNGYFYSAIQSVGGGQVHRGRDVWIALTTNLPPNYAEVSSRAMSALQGLEQSTNYTDSVAEGLRWEIASATPGNYETVSNRAMSALQGYVETDPTVGITNGTIWVKGESVTPITEHQSLFFTNFYVRKLAYEAGMATKQTNLVSGVNIATVNGMSLLSGTNIVVSGGLPEVPYLWPQYPSDKYSLIGWYDIDLNEHVGWEYRDYVRYLTGQNLSDGEKETARWNISAAGTGDLSSHASDTNLHWTAARTNKLAWLENAINLHWAEIESVEGSLQAHVTNRIVHVTSYEKGLIGTIEDKQDALPYNPTNIPWRYIGGRPRNVGYFSNDVGYVTKAVTNAVGSEVRANKAELEGDISSLESSLNASIGAVGARVTSIENNGAARVAGQISVYASYPTGYNYPIKTWDGANTFRIGPGASDSGVKFTYVSMGDYPYLRIAADKDVLVTHDHYGEGMSWVTNSLEGQQARLVSASNALSSADAQLALATAALGARVGTNETAIAGLGTAVRSNAVEIAGVQTNAVGLGSMVVGVSNRVEEVNESLTEAFSSLKMDRLYDVNTNIVYARYKLYRGQVETVWVLSSTNRIVGLSYTDYLGAIESGTETDWHSLRYRVYSDGSGNFLNGPANQNRQVIPSSKYFESGTPLFPMEKNEVFKGDFCEGALPYAELTKLDQWVHVNGYLDGKMRLCDANNVATDSVATVNWTSQGMQQLSSSLGGQIQGLSTTVSSGFSELRAATNRMMNLYEAMEAICDIYDEKAGSVVGLFTVPNADYTGTFTQSGTVDLGSVAKWDGGNPWYGIRGAGLTGRFYVAADVAQRKLYIMDGDTNLTVTAGMKVCDAEALYFLPPVLTNVLTMASGGATHVVTARMDRVDALSDVVRYGVMMDGGGYMRKRIGGVWTVTDRMSTEYELRMAVQSLSNWVESTFQRR